MGSTLEPIIVDPTDEHEQPTLTLRPLTYKPLHETFVAEVEGADLAHPTPDLVEEIKRGLAKVPSSTATSEAFRAEGR